MTDRPNSLPSGRKRGRPADPILTGLREMFPLWSERTIARYKAAMVRFQIMGATQADVERLMDEAKRKTGTLRVNLLDRYTRWTLDKAMRPAKRGRR